MSTWAPKSVRIRLNFLDYARGIAIILMVYIHAFRNIVDASTVRHYALTEIPSLVRILCQAGHGLFIVIFGFLIAYIYIEKTRTTPFWETLLKFFKRALMIFLAYRVCAFFELYGQGEEFHFFNLADTGWTSVLLFYSLACLMVPFILWTWHRVPVFFFYLAIPFFYILYTFSYLIEVPDSLINLKAALVGQPDFYVFPLLPYLSLMLVGFLGGHYFRQYYTYHKKYFSFIAIGLAVLTGLILAIAFSDNYSWHLTHIRNNDYRNPVHFYSLLFTLTLTLLFLALAHTRQFIFHKNNGVIEYLGRHPLTAYIIHIFIIFIPTNYLLGGLRADDTVTGTIGAIIILFLTIACVMAWEKLTKSLQWLTPKD